MSSEKTPMSSSTNASPPTDVSDANMKGMHVVDIRLYLLVITLAMACSFIVGVSFGLPMQQQIRQQEQLQQLQLQQLQQLQQERSENPYEVRSHHEASVGGSVEQGVADSYRDLTHMNLTETDLEHLPAGQHLLVDMSGVESAFLDSEERLSRAMEETVKQSGLTMLSYHCHSLLPSGVSCVGVLLESHISFHTWPEDGVITLDLFTCGANPLLPVVSMIERLFGIPQDETKKVYTKWSHELRGFRPDEVKQKSYLDDSSDLTLWVLSPIDLYSKVPIYSNVTKFQRVDIWDVIDYTDRLQQEDIERHNLLPDDPRLVGGKSLDYVSPDRVLFLDGTIQNVGRNERVYHEALVHPPMFAHPSPKHVLILGGGEGATLREVLKHKTVESAIMLEIDEDLIPIMREHLPKLNNCSDLVGRAPNCFDDELVTIKFEDGRKWFLDRYGPVPTEEVLPDSLDVILVDALDPEDNTIISDILYNDENFITSMMKSLSKDGILAIQIGTAAEIHDLKPDFAIYKNREILFNLLEENEDVEAILVYEEAHCGFLEPHGFIIACKSKDCRSRWYSRNDQVDHQIYERIVKTHSKQRALSFYDGTTQFAYQWSNKGWETNYCMREPQPFECAYRHLDFKAEIHELDLDDKKESSFRVEVKVSEEDRSETTFLYATKNIPKGSYIMPEDLAAAFEVTDRNWEGLQDNIHVGGGRVAVIEDLLSFFDKYAHHSAVSGSAENYVEVGSSVLIRRVDDPSESNVQPWLPSRPRPKYSPVYERHRLAFDVFIIASKDIKEGEEVKMHKDMWTNHLM